MCIRDRYRDVEARLQAAHDAYGDQLAETGQWCLALAEYESALSVTCLLYTSDAADERSSVDLGGRRIIKKKNKNTQTVRRVTDKKRRQVNNER